MPAFTSRFIEARDGLRLHARLYGRPDAGAPTTLCLPGLARTAADFEPLAVHLVAADDRRRVIALDYRGRGLSGRGRDPRHYDLATESADILTVAEALGITAATVVGTSRGGMHAMLLAATTPALLRGAVLNDIGPVLEPAGIARIQGYVGKLPLPDDWDGAVQALKGIAGAQFTGLSDADWRHYADTTFEERDGTFRARYDPALMTNLAALDLNDLPTLWEPYEALRIVPVLVIRGANSDLLSPATLAAMVERHPDCRTLTVPGQGHAPLLTDAPTLRAIEVFVARCESARPPAGKAQGAAATGRRRT